MMSDERSAHGQEVQNRSISAYLEMIASASPTPGGGSVAGVAAAMASSLVEMVCQLTLTRSTPSDVTQRLETSLATLRRLREQFIDLAAADEQAYGTYRAARRLPKATDQEVAKRRQALEQALIDAAEVPLQTAERCVDLLEASKFVAEVGTFHALSDVRCAALLSHAAGVAALANVEVNAALMKNRSRASEFLGKATSLWRELDQLLSVVLGASNARSG